MAATQVRLRSSALCLPIFTLTPIITSPHDVHAQTDVEMETLTWIVIAIAIFIIGRVRCAILHAPFGQKCPSRGRY